MEVKIIKGWEHEDLEKAINDALDNMPKGYKLHDIKYVVWTEGGDLGKTFKEALIIYK